MHMAMNKTETLNLLGSLSDVVPFLGPAKTVIDLIAEALVRVEDNTNQCSYLLRRCVQMCLQINCLFQEARVSELSHSSHVSEFKQ